MRPHIGGRGHTGGVLAHAPSDRRLPLPATVHGVLATRIDRPAPSAKELLQTLAVIGPRCSLRLLRQVVEVPADVLRQRLIALQRAELLYERPALPGHDPLVLERLKSVDDGIVSMG